MQHDKLEIKSIDEKKGGDGFTVTFEVPGHHYNQDFPKRLKHSFPNNGKWTEDVEFEGVSMKRFEKLLRKKYVKSDSIKNSVDVGKLHENYSGKTIQ